VVREMVAYLQEKADEEQEAATRERLRRELGHG
jgi:hypothetical protein